MSQQIRQFTIDLVKKNLNLKPRYINDKNIAGVSNHHPMMMYSLSQMGASQERITQASEINLSHIPRNKHNEAGRVEGFEITDENFMDNLGKEEYYLNYIDYFSQKRTKFQSDDEFLNYYLNKNPSFLYTEGFHCLIRLGFLIDMNLTETYPQFLAYNAMAHFPQINADYTKESISVTEVFEKIFELKEYFESIKYTTFIMYIKMGTLNQNEKFKEIFSHPIKYEGKKTHLEVLDFLIKLYWVTDNFVNMHVMNSFWPFLQVLNRMENQSEAFQSYFTGIMSAFISTFNIHNYSNTLEQMHNIEIQKDLPSFENIFEEVIKSDDEHHAKTVYSLHKQFLKNPTNLLLKQKAAKIAKLI